MNSYIALACLLAVAGVCHGNPIGLGGHVIGAPLVWGPAAVSTANMVKASPIPVIRTVGLGPWGVGSLGVNSWGVGPLGVNSWGHGGLGVKSWGGAPWGVNSWGAGPWGGNGLSGWSGAWGGNGLAGWSGAWGSNHLG